MKISILKSLLRHRFTDIFRKYDWGDLRLKLANERRGVFFCDVVFYFKISVLATSAMMTQLDQGTTKLYFELIHAYMHVINTMIKPMEYIIAITSHKAFI